MTNEEKAIVMAFTGACMLTEDKFDIFHKYVEDLMGRPVYTHEIGMLADEIKERAKDDFINLCKTEDKALEQPKVGRWIEVDPLGTGDKAYQCSECKTGDWSITVEEYQYCPYCGCYMENGGKDYVFPQ